MAELKRESDGKTFNSKEDIKKDVKDTNPDMKETEVEEKVVKESFRVIS